MEKNVIVHIVYVDNVICIHTCITLHACYDLVCNL